LIIARLGSSPLACLAGCLRVRARPRSATTLVQGPLNLPLLNVELHVALIRHPNTDRCPAVGVIGPINGVDASERMPSNNVSSRKFTLHPRRPNAARAPAGMICGGPALARCLWHLRPCMEPGNCPADGKSSIRRATRQIWFTAETGPVRYMRISSLSKAEDLGNIAAFPRASPM